MKVSVVDGSLRRLSHLARPRVRPALSHVKLGGFQHQAARQRIDPTRGRRANYEQSASKTSLFSARVSGRDFQGNLDAPARRAISFRPDVPFGFQPSRSRHGGRTTGRRDGVRDLRTLTAGPHSCLPALHRPCVDLHTRIHPQCPVFRSFLLSQPTPSARFAGLWTPRN